MSHDKEFGVEPSHFFSNQIFTCYSISNINQQLTICQQMIIEKVTKFTIHWGCNMGCSATSKKMLWYTEYILVILYVVIYQIDITLVHFLALWLSLALHFSIFSALWLYFPLSGFLFFGPLDSAYWTSSAETEYWTNWELDNDFGLFECRSSQIFVSPLSSKCVNVNES